MSNIATTIHRAGRRIWVPSEPLRARGFDDVDLGAVDGDVAAANATARRLYQAAARALRRRRQVQAAA